MSKNKKTKPDLSNDQFHQILNCLAEIKETVKNATSSDVVRTWQLLCYDFADDIHLIQQVHQNAYQQRLIEVLSVGVKPHDGANFIGADPNVVECFRLGNVTWMIIEENLNKICNIQKEAACTNSQK